MLPLSAAFEITAFFFISVAGHRPMAALLINLLAAILLSIRAAAPVMPHSFDQRFLVLQTWGFLVPLIWGFSAKWLPVFLGLRSTRNSLLLSAVALNSAGVLAALFDWMKASSLLLTCGIIVAIVALRLLERSERPAKTIGVHRTFPLFVRISYVWAVIASLLGIWASMKAIAPGIWGASRHALTVGFFALMVFSIGQRYPACIQRHEAAFQHTLDVLGFGSAHNRLFAPGWRTGARVPEYVSSGLGLAPSIGCYRATAMTIFAANLIGTFARSAPTVCR